MVVHDRRELFIVRLLIFLLRCDFFTDTSVRELFVCVYLLRKNKQQQNPEKCISKK